MGMVPAVSLQVRQKDAGGWEGCDTTQEMLSKPRLNEDPAQTKTMDSDDAMNLGHADANSYTVFL